MKRGGLVLTLYENSLSIAFSCCSSPLSRCMRQPASTTTTKKQLSHGSRRHADGIRVLGAVLVRIVSELAKRVLSLAAMVTLSIVLRQRGSPESKPFDAPMWETGS